MSDCDSGSQLLTDVARLLNELGRRDRRIDKLEKALREVKDVLSTMTEMHWQDEVFIRDDLGMKGGEDMEAYALDHIVKNGAEVIGRRMLDEGYLEIEESRQRDERYCGTWYRVNIKAITAKSTASIVREMRKNEG